MVNGSRPILKPPAAAVIVGRLLPFRLSVNMDAGRRTVGFGAETGGKGFVELIKYCDSSSRAPSASISGDATAIVGARGGMGDRLGLAVEHEWSEKDVGDADK